MYKLFILAILALPIIAGADDFQIHRDFHNGKIDVHEYHMRLHEQDDLDRQLEQNEQQRQMDQWDNELRQKEILENQEEILRELRRQEEAAQDEKSRKELNEFLGISPDSIWY